MSFLKNDMLFPVTVAVVDQTTIEARLGVWNSDSRFMPQGVGSGQWAVGSGGLAVESAPKGDIGVTITS